MGALPVFFLEWLLEDERLAMVEKKCVFVVLDEKDERSNEMKWNKRMKRMGTRE